MRAGSITERCGSPVPSRARSVITRCTSTGCTCPTARPDSTASAVSAATAPTPRPACGSSSWCPATTERARASSAAWAPATSTIGPSTLRYPIPSGAARTVTRRERTAASIRATTAAASSSAATARAARSAPRTPSRPSSGPTRPSNTARSATPSTQAAWATRTAAASEHTPAPNAPNVRGIWCTNTALTRTNRSPHHGDSRRANATSEPTERATSRGATTSRESRTASTNRACNAAAAPLTRSSSATRSTRSRSDAPPTSTEPSTSRNPRTTATGDTSPSGVTEPAAVVPAPPGPPSTTPPAMPPIVQTSTDSPDAGAGGLWTTESGRAGTSVGREREGDGAVGGTALVATEPSGVVPQAAGSVGGADRAALGVEPLEDRHGRPARVAQRARRRLRTVAGFVGAERPVPGLSRAGASRSSRGAGRATR